jgi:hypothetical protein
LLRELLIKWPLAKWRSDQVPSQIDDEQYHRSYNFKWKIQRRILTVATHFNNSDRYAFRVQMFSISCAILRFCNDHQQSTRTIATSVWTNFVKSMLFTWTTIRGLLTRWKTYRFIRVHLRRKNKNYCIFKSSSIITI